MYFIAYPLSKIHKKWHYLREKQATFWRRGVPQQYFGKCRDARIQSTPFAGYLIILIPDFGTLNCAAYKY
jgi:hypothetical protein